MPRQITCNVTAHNFIVRHLNDDTFLIPTFALSLKNPVLLLLHPLHSIYSERSVTKRWRQLINFAKNTVTERQKFSSWLSWTSLCATGDDCDVIRGLKQNFSLLRTEWRLSANVIRRQAPSCYRRVRKSDISIMTGLRDGEREFIVLTEQKLCFVLFLQLNLWTWWQEGIWGGKV